MNVDGLDTHCELKKDDITKMGFEWLSKGNRNRETFAY